MLTHAAVSTLVSQDFSFEGPVIVKGRNTYCWPSRGKPFWLVIMSIMLYAVWKFSLFEMVITINSTASNLYRFGKTSHYCYSEYGKLFHDIGENFIRLATNEKRNETCLQCGYMKPTSFSKYLNMYDVSECELVISTVLFKGYDKFRPLNKGYDDVPAKCFFVFTDSKSKFHISRGYTHIYVNIYSDDTPYDDGARLSKIFKIIPQRVFRNLRWHVHIEGKSNLNGNYTWLLDEVRSSNHSNIIVERHKYRIDVYKEGKRIKILERDLVKIVNKQLGDYQDQRYPKDNGLLDSHFLFRDFGYKNIQTMSCVWFDEVNRGSRRDQLSFNYVVWKLGLEVKYFPYGYFVRDKGHVFFDAKTK